MGENNYQWSQEEYLEILKQIPPKEIPAGMANDIRQMLFNIEVFAVLIGMDLEEHAIQLDEVNKNLQSIIDTSIILGNVINAFVEYSKDHSS